MSMKQTRIRPALRRHCLALLTALLASCAILPPPVSQQAATEEAAENAAHKGDHARAATDYESLAASRTGGICWPTPPKFAAPIPPPQ